MNKLLMSLKYRKKALLVDLAMWSILIGLLATGFVKAGILFFIAGVSFEFIVYPAILKARHQKMLEQMSDEDDYEDDEYDETEDEEASA